MLQEAVKSSWNVMAHGDAREKKWSGNWQTDWVASILHTTSEHGVPSITTADAYTSVASRWLNWSSRRFKWTRPFHRKTKSGLCACAITFQTHSTCSYRWAFKYETFFLFVLPIFWEAWTQFFRLHFRCVCLPCLFHNFIQRYWPFDWKRHLRWHRWMNTQPRLINAWYGSLVGIIITLSYSFYSFWWLIKYN